MAKLDAPALAQLFTEARTRNGWKTDPLPESLLRELSDLVKFGPTAETGGSSGWTGPDSREPGQAFGLRSDDLHQTIWAASSKSRRGLRAKRPSSVP